MEWLPLSSFVGERRCLPVFFPDIVGCTRFVNVVACRWVFLPLLQTGKGDPLHSSQFLSLRLRQEADRSCKVVTAVLVDFGFCVLVFKGDFDSWRNLVTVLPVGKCE